MDWASWHEALTNYIFQAARFLLKPEISTGASDPERQTPLIGAVFKRNTKMVEIISDFSDDPSAIDVDNDEEMTMTLIETILQEMVNEVDSVSSDVTVITA